MTLKSRLTWKIITEKDEKTSVFKINEILEMFQKSKLQTDRSLKYKEIMPLSSPLLF